MGKFYSLENIEIIDIEASEEIEKKNLKSFISTFFELKNINLSSNSKIVLNYIKELKIYQILLIKEKFNNLEIELFYKLLENNEKEFISFIYEKYFLIFKNNKIYYIQNIDENIDNRELLSYLNKNFKITFDTFITINKDELYKNEIVKKTNIKFFDIKKDYSFYFFLLYMFCLAFFCLLFFMQENYKSQESYEKENNLDIKILENAYKFDSFEQWLKKIFYKLEQENLKVEKFSFIEDILNLEISSSNKDDIYKFLEDKDFVFLSSKIDFIENKNIYKAKIDVQIYK
ncbi:hypothetical protein [Arcobacter vandammei]|uniref:hypothetical protein n=1 Tax=Arcobacter vandammei TaxID=2782243 RepID=UPI0018E055E4|nr:hypothetical protein [Arcobacter vandammei]